MKKSLLGNTGIELPRIGLGCMGLSEFYGAALEERASIQLLHQAIDHDVQHFDTAEMYGIGSANEVLLGKAFSDRRDKVFIATKFGPIRDETGAFTGMSGSPENCRRAIEGSLQRLQTDYVDLYYLHRVDSNVPVEETVGAMAELVAEGKVRAIGLSEASADTIRKATKVHPVSAVQSEYSIFSRDIEKEVIPACQEVGASLVAYSPLGRGMLSGKFKNETLTDDDWRLSTPRYQGDAFKAHVALVDEIENMAASKSCTAAQIALAWVMSRGDFLHALSGTTKLKNLQSNIGAYDVVLHDDDIKTLGELASRVMGDRYDEYGMSGING